MCVEIKGEQIGERAFVETLGKDGGNRWHGTALVGYTSAVTLFCRYSRFRNMGR